MGIVNCKVFFLNGRYIFVAGPRRVSLRAVPVEHDPKAPAAHSDRREKGELIFKKLSNVISGSVLCSLCQD